jgi:hypothetical protein
VTVTPIDVDPHWLRAAGSLEDAAALTAQLVSVRSYPGEEGAVQRVIAARQHANGPGPSVTVSSGSARLRQEVGPGSVLLVARALTCRRDLWRGTRLVSSVVDVEAFSVGALRRATG